MQVDARDLFSPKPTVMALEALSQLKKHETLTVLVNDGKAVDDLIHLAEEHTCSFCLEDEGDYSVVILTPEEKVSIDKPLEEALRLMGITPLEAPVIIFGSESLGHGNDEIGRILAQEFIMQLTVQERLPSALVFYNSGAKLTCKDSPLAEQLTQLIEQGVEVLTDSVSAEAYCLTGECTVGEIVDPYIVMTLLANQPGVITL